jgi:glutamyl-Q tRNA(Asp) synthetase
MGSLVSAVASWLDARAHHGVWLVRIEDIDESRCRPAWAASILRTLERHGLAPDEEAVYQSRRKDLYREALHRLAGQGLAYPCACSRKQIGDAPYSGACRSGLPPGRQPRAWRFRVPPGPVSFHDRAHGPFCQHVSEQAGDFVLLRADGYFAYQLAVVVDDADQRITHIVRGADLLDNTPRQLLLQDALQYPHPLYLHHPLVLAADGAKLSKQTRARPVDELDPAAALRHALSFLGLCALTLDEAIQEWRSRWLTPTAPPPPAPTLPHTRSLPSPP